MRLRGRLLQILGIVVALAGLIGYWLTRDVATSPVTEAQCELLGMEDCQGFHASFVVAGKDIFYEPGKSTPVYDSKGNIVAWDYSGRKTADGTNTDTILYVTIIGSDITIIPIPRDIYVPAWDKRINAVYARAGGEGLKKTVEEIVGLPIDYYAIINTDIFKDFVDALGGVDINVPYAMDHDDNAGNLHIHLSPGLQTLNGEKAMGFIRFRDTPRGDLDRLDNLKSLAYAALHKLKTMNVQAAVKLPGIIEAVISNVETNATPALVRQLTTRLSSLQLKQARTLPVFEEGNHLSYNAKDVEVFIAELFNGKARTFEEAPRLTLLITNKSGVAGLQDVYKERLITMGIAEDLIFTANDLAEPTPSRLLVTSSHWEEAEYFSSLLQIGKQQLDHLDRYKKQQIDLELVLGEDARNSLFATQDEVVVTSAR